MKYMMSFIALLALAVMAAPSWARADNAGQFTEIMGQVTVRKVSGQSISAVLGTSVRQGDLVLTERGAKATILFNDGSVLRLGPSTSLQINRLVYDEESGVVDAAYNLARGALMSVVGSLFGNEGSDYQVTTPTSVSGVRGTMYFLMVYKDPDTGATNTVAVGLDGTVNFGGIQGGSYGLGPMMYSIAGPDGIAQLPAEMSPEELQKLLDLVTMETTSLDQRAKALRELLQTLVTGGTLFLVDLPGGQLDPGDLPAGDNPSDLIYQEPPQMTELIIIVNMP